MILRWCYYKSSTCDMYLFTSKFSNLYLVIFENMFFQFGNFFPRFCFRFSWAKIFQKVNKFCKLICWRRTDTPLFVMQLLFSSFILQSWGTVEQGAASLRVTAKSSGRRHFFFNDVWRHCHHHLIFKMTWGVVVIVINPS